MSDAAEAPDDDWLHAREKRKALRLSTFRRNRWRFEQIGARWVTEVAEFCGREHPNGRASPEAYARSLDDLSTAIMQGRFDAGHRSCVLWVPEEYDILRLTSALAKKIRGHDHGQEALNQHTLELCWLSSAGWRKWLAYLNREPPASWVQQEPTAPPKPKPTSKKPRQPYALQRAKSYLDTHPGAGPQQVCREASVGLRTASRAIEEFRAK